MKKLITNTVLALIGLVMFAFTAQAQTPPTNTPYITMTVTNNDSVKINMKAAAANTSVWIETAPNTYTQVTVGTSWTGFVNYTATGTTIKVHGNLEKFDCSENYTKLTGLAFSSGLTNLQDLSCENNSLTTLNVSGLTNLKYLSCYNNSLTTLNVSGLTNLERLWCFNNSLTTLNVSELTKLEWLYCNNNNSLTTLNVSGLTNLRILYCYNNNFSTQAIDDIYCALSQRPSNNKGTLYIANTDSDANISVIKASNAQNARAKNWNVWYYDNYSGSLHDTDVSTTGNWTCPPATPPAGTPYITMTVTNNATVQIAMMGTTANTPVWVETAPNTYTQVTVGTSWPNYVNYAAIGTIIKVYGNLKSFSCWGNYSKLTGLTFSNGLTNLKILSCANNSLTTLDVSGLTSLGKLWCFGNNFSTQAIDDIYCALPQRDTSDNARIYPVYADTSANYATVMTTNKTNATNKNWKVQYYVGSADIPATTGSWTCPPATPPTGTPYITMTVTKDSTVQIDMMAAAAGTPVWVETSTGNYTPVTVGTSWTGFVNYAATGTTIKVHGNLKGFNCSENDSKLTGLTFSDGLTNLTTLYCSYNTLISLNVSWLTNLEWLYCNYNELTVLDVSGLANLERLDCSYNKLTSLNVSGLTNLKELRCYNNNFSTQAIDDIYCALSQGPSNNKGTLYIANTDSDANISAIKASNAQNARAKNWNVWYYDNYSGSLHDTDVSTTGSWTCPPATPPAGTPYITMTVTNNDSVQINMQAAAANTPVWIETAPNTYTQVTVDTNWTNWKYYTATDTTIKVHGNLKRFNCSYNFTKLTGLTFSSGLTNLLFLYCSYNYSISALDVSKLTNLITLSCYENSISALDVSGLTNLGWLDCANNSLTALDVSGLTNLEWLDCYNNNFSTQAIDDIYCALPQRQISDNAVIKPVYNSSSANHAVVMATNKTNATNKNWKVQYTTNNTDIPETTGTYVCGSTPPIGTPYITMTVTNNDTVKIKMQAAAANTPVWIETEPGIYTQVTVDTVWTSGNYTAKDTIIKVHGNLKGFNCSENDSKLTGLTFSDGLTNLTTLYCSYNTLISLNVSWLTNLEWLYCNYNELTVLDVSGLANLETLFCYNNKLTSLNVSGLANLETLECFNNKLTSLNVSGLANLKWLDCSYNKLTSLNVSGLANLETLFCYNNKLTSLNVSGLANLERLDCSYNKLTSLNVSGLTNLKELRCYNNNFSTQAIDDIYCSLPQRQTSDNARILPILSSNSTNYDVVMATNKQNAIAKNWEVQYAAIGGDIPATSGTYVCGTPYAGTPYITMTVTNNDTVKIKMQAAAANTPVWIETEPGIYTQVTVDTVWTSGNYTAKDTVIKVHGNLKGFNCSENDSKLTGLVFSSGLTNLQDLYCYNNSLTALSVSGLTDLRTLYCHNNNFSTQAIDNIYCALPERIDTDGAVIYPIENSNSADTTIVLATNKWNAINKNWKVQYVNDTDIPDTQGSYVCGTTRVADVVAAEQLSIYPNPAKEMVTVELNESYTGLLQITDISGKMLISHKINGTHVSVDISALSKGIYLVKVGSKVEKLIVK